MLEFGRSLAEASVDALLITLAGDLGAGKTTLARGFLRGLGYQGKVKSPTFTLVEPYALQCGNLYHFDLYRLADADELEFLGFRDYLADSNYCLLEWPERAEEWLPVADVAVAINGGGESRSVRLQAQTARGEHFLAGLRATGIRGYNCS